MYCTAVYRERTDDKIFELVRKGKPSPPALPGPCCLLLVGFCPEVKPGYGPWFPASMPISDSAKDLIAKLLTRDVAVGACCLVARLTSLRGCCPLGQKRLTAAEALEHPWLVGTTAPDAPLVATVLSNLKAFNGTCKFKQGKGIFHSRQPCGLARFLSAAVLSLMTDYLSKEELAQLRVGALRSSAVLFCAACSAVSVFADRRHSRRSMRTRTDSSLRTSSRRPYRSGRAGAKPWLTVVLPPCRRNSGDLKIAEEELQALMKIADVDGDGTLSTPYASAASGSCLFSRS